MILPKYYTSIHTCPMQAWRKVTQTGDLHGLHISGLKSERKALKAYDAIQREYIETFGLPDEYMYYLQQAQQGLAEYYEATKGREVDRWKMTLANIILTEAKQLLKTGPGDSFPVVLANVSKHMGFAIDLDRTTIAQFYGYIEAINKASNRQG